jgi:phospholipid/cholesterol/gamma-HCH transport system permease protein
MSGAATTGRQAGARDDTPAEMSASRQDGAQVITLRGRLDLNAAGRLWQHAMRTAGQAGKVRIDLSGLTGCDTAGATLLLALEDAPSQGKAEISGASPRITEILASMRAAAAAAPRQSAAPSPGWRETFLSIWGKGTAGVAYLGELAMTVAFLPRHARMFRRNDLLRVADQSGAQAIPLVLLLGTLIGLILAFQSLIPMRQFGADIYVANLVAISLVRELGPLLVAVILAGRSGSAFAAEIGTMKVNQELDALVTMGLDPMTMLVLPRLLATMVMAPVLTVVMNLAGMLGMSIVLVGAGIPLTAIANQITFWVTTKDLYGGLVKAAVFGFAVAAVGCRAGLSTGVGPRAVGVSATNAVVGGIVISIALDGAFALIFYRMGL